MFLSCENINEEWDDEYKEPLEEINITQVDKIQLVWTKKEMIKT